MRVTGSRQARLASLGLIAMILPAVACAVSVGDPADAVMTLGAPRPLAAPEALPGSGEANLFAGGGKVHMSWLEPGSGQEWSLRFATLTDEAWSLPRTVVSSTEFFVNWVDFPSIIATPGQAWWPTGCSAAVREPMPTTCG